VGQESKTRQARLIGISRQLLYYRHKKPPKDWELKTKIEAVLREHPSYGHKRLAIHLQINKKRVLRVMKLFGIKPYRKRSKKFRYIRANRDCEFPNLLLANFPYRPNQIWASDFTHIAFRGGWIYLATIIDLFNREIAGFSVLTNHGTPLIINALFSATINHPAPEMIHSDHGSEYASEDYSIICQSLDIKQSMSQPGCPWENGYQESFYSQFKIDLGDPERFNSLGELVYAIYKTIYSYNHSRIHTKLKMPPVLYSRRYQLVHGEVV
jgi:putative transposase